MNASHYFSEQVFLKTAGKASSNDISKVTKKIRHSQPRSWTLLLVVPSISPASCHLSRGLSPKTWSIKPMRSNRKRLRLITRGYNQNYRHLRRTHPTKIGTANTQGTTVLDRGSTERRLETPESSRVEALEIHFIIPKLDEYPLLLKLEQGLSAVKPHNVRTVMGDPWGKGDGTDASRNPKGNEKQHLRSRLSNLPTCQPLSEVQECRFELYRQAKEDGKIVDESVFLQSGKTNIDDWISGHIKSRVWHEQHSWWSSHVRPSTVRWGDARKRVE